MSYTKILLISLFLIIGVYYSYAQTDNVTITDDDSYSPKPSAMLDIYSLTKGMLVPRMSAVQMATITGPTRGLLIFNTTTNSFWFHNGTIWESLSDDTESLWGVSPTGVYLSDLTTNIGIGTDEPFSKVSVVANADANPYDPLFEIRDNQNNPIFSVTSEGVRIYVKDINSKGTSGGFAVGRYGTAKGIPDTTYFMVTPDSTRVYIKKQIEKGVSGGFAVGRYGTANGEVNTIFFASPDSTRVYTGSGTKGVSGGFAVGRYGTAKGEGDRYTFINDDNCFIGMDAGLNNDEAPPLGMNNVFLGKNSGKANYHGSANVYIGAETGTNHAAGMFNVFIGNAAGVDASTSRSIFIGSFAGRYETESDKLYIETESGATGNEALIYGDFLNDNLQLNANTGIGGPSNSEYQLYVYGNAWSIGAWMSSDKKWKKNISKIEYGLDIINKLNPVSYNWKSEKYPEMNFTEEKQIGFIAQELELIVPELVKTDSDGNKAVSYSKLTPILVKAIQEQQKQIEELQKQIEILKQK